MAASIVGMSALVAKPGESFAPIFGWRLLGGLLLSAPLLASSSASQLIPKANDVRIQYEPMT